jgi:hypothetical protein
MVSVKFAPRDAPFIGKGRWSWPKTMLDDEDLIQKVITKGIDLQLELEKWKIENTDCKLSNPQTMWESFKLDIKRTAKEHEKMSAHKINAKTKSLEKKRKTMLTSEDFKVNDTCQAEEALLANEIAHLE